MGKSVLKRLKVRENQRQRESGLRNKRLMRKVVVNSRIRKAGESIYR